MPCPFLPCVSHLLWLLSFIPLPAPNCLKASWKAAFLFFFLPLSEIPSPNPFLLLLAGVVNACWQMGFQGGSDGKESACNGGDLGSIPRLGRFPWRREWLPTPVFLPGKSHGQRSLAGYGPWVAKSRTRMKQLSTPARGDKIYTLK